MSNLERHFHSSEGVSLSSEEIDSCIEECQSFIQKSKNLGCCPEEILGASNKEVMSESFVDSLTEKEVDNVREKLFNYWDTTKTQYESGGTDKTSKVVKLQDSEPTTQSEEAVISFEDAKSEVHSTAKKFVQRYDIQQLIEAELKDIRKSKLSKDGCTSTKTHEPKLPVMESMDFTELEKKAADLPGIAGIEISRLVKLLPVPRRTDALEVLLRIYEYSSVDSTEKAVTYLAASETGDLSTDQMRKVQEFRKHIVVEMKVIYERLISTYPLETHRAPENIETSNSSSSGSRTKDSSSSKITTQAIHPVSPLELSTSAYPELTTRSQAVSRDDDTISSLPFSTMDSNTGRSASGLINDPVIDMAAAQPKSSTSSKSSGDSVSNTTTSSTEISEEDNTLSGISSLPTDPRASVSSLRDVDPRTSVSSLKDTDNRTSVSDIESLAAVISPIVLQQNLLSEDEASDDAFLTMPLVPTANPLASALPSTMDSTETTQNPRRRGRSSKEDEDKNEAKRPAL